jgi:hypothetical protein
MIVYGWNNRIIKEAPLEKLPCVHCGSESVKAKISVSYVHLFWIPLFPYKKSGQFECEQCKNVIADSQLEETMTLLKKSVRFPFYMFSGMAVIIAFIAYLFINSAVEEKKELGYLSIPEVGDIYHLKDNEEVTEYKYYLWKAEEVFDDSLYVSQNAYTYNMIPEELMEKDGFVESYYVIKKKLLQELYDSGELVKIQRGYGEYSSFSRVIPEELDSLSSSIQ